MKSPFRKIQFFVFCFGALLLVDILASSYFRSSLTTIERRFELPTTMIAIISSCYQIGSLVVVLFVSYYGSRWHRPRALAIGSSIITIGYFLDSLPQFLGERYEYVDTMQNSSSAATKQVEMCQINEEYPSTNVTCGIHQNEAPKTRWYLLILVGNTLCGLGAAATQPLGMSYVDDFSHPRKAPVYIGVVMSMALIGPAIGFSLGALIMRIWVDVGWVNTDEVGIAPTNPAWVGAWWLGCIISASVIAIVSIPFWCFPRKMKKQKDSDKKSSTMPEYPFAKHDGEKSEKLHQEALPTPQKGGMLQTFLRLLGNKQFVLLSLAWLFGSISIVGVITFFPKYLEVHFGVSAAKANMLFGCTSIPCLVIGTMLGSYILKRTNAGPLGITKILMIAHFAGFLTALPIAIIGCETIDVAGVTVNYAAGANENQGTLVPISGCNQNCHCEEGGYSPICGNDGVTYLTPCHAGCEGIFSNEPGKIQNYTDCSCVNPTDKQPLSHWSSPKRCQRSKCEHLLLLVMVLKGFANFLGGIAATPSYVLLLRVVRQQDKAFAIGLIFLVTRLGGWIPGPILYGKAIDSTCLYWGTSHCGSGTCKVYDNIAYRRTFFGIYFGAELCYLAMAVALYFVTRQLTYKKKREEFAVIPDAKDPLIEESPPQPANVSLRATARLASECESEASLELKRLDTDHRALLFRAEEALAAKETEILA